MMKRGERRGKRRLFRKMVSLLLTFVMIMSYLPAGSGRVRAADDNDWTDHAEEAVLQDGVYEISTAARLAWVAKGINDGTLETGYYDQDKREYVYYTFRLTSDIDLSEHLWVPIGNTYNRRFYAVLDGAGHTISGMRVGTETKYRDDCYGGLFGVLGGTVKELKITGAKVCVSQKPGEDSFECYGGLVAGYMSGGSISRCTVDGEVHVPGHSAGYSSRYCSAGGLVGSLDSGLVDSCRINAELYLENKDRKASIGGIAGNYDSDSSYNKALVTNCVLVANTHADSEANGLSLDAFFGTGYYGTLNNSIARATYTGKTKDLGQYTHILDQVKNAENICAYEINAGAGTDERGRYAATKDDEEDKTLADMKSQAFVDTLNTAAAGIDGAREWSLTEANDGFPDLAGAGLPVYHTVSFISAGETLLTRRTADGNPVEKPEDPARKGYTFVYWYTDDPETPYDFDTPVTDALNINALWDAHDHVVEFDPLGGSYVYPQVVKTDAHIERPVDPVFKGREFKGWFTDRAYRNLWDFENDVVSNDMTLYARWEVSALPAISGRITSKRSGAGIEGATVTIKKDSVEKTAYTDTFGFYHIDGITSGTYGITASAAGFVDETGEVTINDGSTGWDAALTPVSSGGGGGGGGDEKSRKIYIDVSCLKTGMKLSRVTVRYTNGSLTGMTMTDDNGVAVLEDLPDDICSFEVNWDGKKAGWRGAISKTYDGVEKKGDLYVQCALEPVYQKLDVKVTGYDPVKDKDGQDLEGIKVSLKGLHPQNRKIVLVDDVSAYTDADGNVTFDDLAPITWVVSAGATPYTTVTETVQSDKSGKLTKKRLSLYLPFVASKLKVIPTSDYADKDIFKKTSGSGSSGSKPSSGGGRDILKVTISGVAGTVTEGITREAELDDQGIALFERLSPGAYMVSAAGSVKKYVAVPAGADGKEIYSSTEDTRYGPKYFYAEFNGSGSANTRYGKTSEAELKLTASPVSFSGTLYKADMNRNGEIKVTPCKDVKLTIRPSYYYQQNGAKEQVVRTDDRGYYSTVLDPGLYGVTTEGFYSDYFGGQLIYHTGATDNCYYDYNFRGWPCYGQWVGTRESAWAWLSSGTQKPYADIAGMNLSSGDVVADLVMMEKVFNYSLGEHPLPQGGGFNNETASDMLRIMGMELNTSTDYEHVYYNKYYRFSHHTESNGATVTMSAMDEETKTMTGKRFPAVFSKLAPGDYAFSYEYDKKSFSHLDLDILRTGSRTWEPYDGVREVRFYDFPSPGELPQYGDFPEDYVDIRYPDDPCHNPWPCTTVFDDEAGLHFNEDTAGHRTLDELYDEDPSNGEIQFKFFARNRYSRAHLTAEEKEELLRRSDINDFHLDTYSEKNELNPVSSGEIDEDLIPSGSPEETETETLTPNASAPGSESGEDGLDAAGAVYNPGGPLYAWYYDDDAEHMADKPLEYDGGIWGGLFAYTTDKCPGVLFYMPNFAYQQDRRDPYQDKDHAAIPDGNVELFFNAPKGTSRHETFFPNATDHRNLQRYGAAEKKDLWFKVPVPESGLQVSAINFASGVCQNGTVLKKSDIEKYLTAESVEVKSVYEFNGERILDPIDVPVTVTIGGRSYQSGHIYTVDSAFSYSVDNISVDSEEWEYVRESGSVVGYYDDASKKAVLQVPLTRKPRIVKFRLEDTFGHPVQNADISLTGLKRGLPVIGTTDSNGEATIGHRPQYGYGDAEEVLTYQDYTVRIHAQGYEDKVYVITADKFNGNETIDVEEKVASINQPVFKDDTLEMDKKGSFLPGVNFSATESEVIFYRPGLEGPLFLNMYVEMERAEDDTICEVYVIDRKKFVNLDFSDEPTELRIPSTKDAQYNPSAVYDWLERLKNGELGQVFWRCFTNESIDLEYSVNTDKLHAKIPIWELPPDDFCPTIVAVTGKGAIQIYNKEYDDNDPEQLTGIRINGRQALIYNTIADMAGGTPVPQEMAEAVSYISMPTGMMIPRTYYTASIKEDSRGYLDYGYKLNVDLIQGSATPAGQSAPNLSILSGISGVVINGEWNMALAGEQRRFEEKFNVQASRKNMDIDKYLPALFKAFPVKISFDPDPTGGFGYTGSKTVDNRNQITRDFQKMEANAYAGLKGEVSAFSAAGKAFPGVGTVLESLEKSGAADMGVHLKLSAGVDGSYQYELIPAASPDPSERIDIAVGAGAAAGVYAKTLGGTLGAEANARVGGDNPRLPDMTELKATISQEDGFELNEITGKLAADAKIYVQSWFINGEKTFEFGSVPFTYKFGKNDNVNDSLIAISEISVQENMISGEDYIPSEYNSDPSSKDNVLATNYLTMGKRGMDEKGTGSSVMTDKSGGAGVRLVLVEQKSASAVSAAGGLEPAGAVKTGYSGPVEMTTVSGLIPSCDMVSLGDGRVMAAWCEIAEEEMDKTCPPSAIRFMTGKVQGDSISPRVPVSLSEREDMVTDDLKLCRSGDRVFLIAQKTGEGPLAERHSIYGYVWSNGEWSKAFELADNVRLYETQACGTDEGVTVVCTNDDYEAMIISWDGSSDPKTDTYEVDGLEIAAASNGSRTAVINRNEDGIGLKVIADGRIRDYGTVVEALYPSNLALAMAEDGSMVVSWTAENDKELRTVNLTKGGRVNGAAETLEQTEEGGYYGTEITINGKTATLQTVLNLRKGEASDASVKAFGFELEGSSGKDVEVSSIVPDPSKLTLTVGSNRKVNVTVLPENATDKGVYYESTDKNVAEVSSSGRVTGKAKGSAGIMIYAGTISVRVPVKVLEEMVPASSVTLDKDELTLEAGSSDTLSANILPVNATEPDLAWTSGDRRIVMVTESETDPGTAVVKGLKAGNALVKVTVTSPDGTQVEAECSVKVNGASGGDPGYEGDENGAIEASFEDEEVKDIGVSYTGSAIKPGILVTNGDRLLIEGVDYKVKFGKNTDAGTGTVTIIGMGLYTDKKTMEFPILQKDLSDEDVVAGNTATVKGKAASPVLAFMGKALKVGKDYEKVTDVVNADGEITIRAKAGGNFKGEKKVTVKAIDKNASKAIKADLAATDFIYDGGTHELTVASPGTENGKHLIVTDKKTKAVLTEDVDFVVSTGNSVNAGKVSVLVIGAGDYGGKAGKSFKVAPAVWKPGTAKGVKAFIPSGLQKQYEYRSFKVTPFVAIEAEFEGGGTETLVPGRDYKLSYKGNAGVGTASVRFSFMGNYKGSALDDLPFGIVKAPLSAENTTAAMPQTLSYDEKKKAAKNYFLKPGKNLFLDLDGVSLKPADYTVSWVDDKGGAIDGKAELPAGTTITVMAAPKAGSKTYTGESFVIGSYTLRAPAGGDTDISKAKVKVTVRNGNDVRYTGLPIEFDPSDDSRQADISVKVGNKEIKGSEVYEAFDVSYANNRLKGSANVIVSAKEGSGYSGYAVGRFRIAPAGIALKK